MAPAQGSADVADVDQLVREDTSGFGHQVVRAGRGQLDVGDHAANGDRVPDDLGDPRLDAGAPALGLLLEEGLLLREAQRDDRAVDGDRPASDDQRLGRRVGTEALDDGRPGREQLLEGRVRGLGGDRRRGLGVGVAAFGRDGGGSSGETVAAAVVGAGGGVEVGRPARVGAVGSGVAADGPSSAGSDAGGVAIAPARVVGLDGDDGEGAGGRSAVVAGSWEPGACLAGAPVTPPPLSSRNIANSSWKRSPPIVARFGSIAARRRPAAASAIGSWRTAAGSEREATSSPRMASTA